MPVFTYIHATRDMNMLVCIRQPPGRYGCCLFPGWHPTQSRDCESDGERGLCYCGSAPCVWSIRSVG